MLVKTWKEMYWNLSLRWGDEIKSIMKILGRER